MRVYAKYANLATLEYFSASAWKSAVRMGGGGHGYRKLLRPGVYWANHYSTNLAYVASRTKDGLDKMLKHIQSEP